MATDGEGRTVLFYTSVSDLDYDRGKIRVATPADASWETWLKGPVVAGVPEGLGVTAFRDPSVFEDRGVWRMFVGAGYADGRAGVLGFSSPDLNSWTFDGPVAERETNKVDTGTADRVIWECPHLIRLGDHDLLVTSVWADGETCYVEVGIGHYRDGRFAASDWSRLTFGGPYAAMPFTDDGGCTGLIFWLREVRDHAAGWAGALSVPYLVSVEDGAVRLVPHDMLRSTDGWRTIRRDGDATQVPLPDGATLEVTSERDGFRMSAWGHDLLVPAGASDATAQLLVDGPVVELCTGTALASLPMMRP
jgi:beta-fructofuranosidase